MKLIPWIAALSTFLSSATSIAYGSYTGAYAYMFPVAIKIGQPFSLTLAGTPTHDPRYRLALNMQLCQNGNSLPCGNEISPNLTSSQVGQNLLENVIFNEDGQILQSILDDTSDGNKYATFRVVEYSTEETFLNGIRIQANTVPIFPLGS